MGGDIFYIDVVIKYKRVMMMIKNKVDKYFLIVHVLENIIFIISRPRQAGTPTNIYLIFLLNVKKLTS